MIGAGEGNRTLVISLEGCCSTIELHPRTRSPTCEPTFAKTSAGAFAIRRLASRSAAGAKAGGGGRTRTYEGVSQRIYSPPPLPLGTLPRTSHPRGMHGLVGLWGAPCAVSTAPNPPAPALKTRLIS